LGGVVFDAPLDAQLLGDRLGALSEPLGVRGRARMRDERAILAFLAYTATGALRVGPQISDDAARKARLGRRRRDHIGGDGHRAVPLSFPLGVGARHASP